MANFCLVIALILAVSATWVAWVKAPQWRRRARVKARLNRDGEAEGVLGFWPYEWARKFTEVSLTAKDFKEIRDALAVTGRSQEQAPLLYLVFCWVLPLMVIVVGFAVFGLLAGMIISAAAFLLPRRTIRGMAGNAEHRQNLEAIELCQLTKIMSEAGLSLERILRVVAAQGEPIMPMLCQRIDRFNRLLESGAERTQALEEFGDNKNIPVLRGYVLLMKQSGQLGAAVSGSLTQIIDEARETERNRIKETTNRIGAKMTVVMMIFMLPTLFLLIGGPAVIQILDVLNR